MRQRAERFCAPHLIAPEVAPHRFVRPPPPPRRRRFLTSIVVIVISATGLVFGRTLSKPPPPPPPPPPPVAPPEARPADNAIAGVVRPLASGVYWGAYVDGGPYRHSAETDLENVVGSRPSFLMWYQEWQDAPAFPALEAKWLAERGIVPVICWEPWRPPPFFGEIAVDQPNYKLSRIAGGSFDPYLRSYAQQIKKYAGPVVLRPFHEMDGFWYPWSGTVNGNTPADYVRAWKHVHDIFTAAGATNVTWVWSVNHITVPNRDDNQIELYWPGASYVDWIGISGFNWGGASPLSVWKGFDSVVGPRYQRLLKYRKPIALMETGAPEAGGNKAAWIRATFRTILADYPQMKAVIWYDKKDSDVRDWRIGSSLDSIAAFRSAIADPTFRSADSAQVSAITSLASRTPPTFVDAFQRKVSGSWGRSSVGPWAPVTYVGQQARLSVDGEVAVADARAPGVSRVILISGPASDANVNTAATFQFGHQASTDPPDEARILLRVAGPQSYYGFMVAPGAGDGPGQITILRVVDGNFTDIASGELPYRLTLGVRYRVEARVVTAVNGVHLSLRVWRATAAKPFGWTLVANDQSPERILAGRVGVRLSFGGPSVMLVDDFASGPVTSP